MIRNNFRMASSTADELDQKVAALQTDFLRILDQDGVSGIRANPRFEMKAARLLREVVTDRFSMTDPTPIFTERRDARLGDKIEFERLINTLRVVKYAPGSHPLVFTPRKAKYTVSTSSFELPFGIPLMKILERTHTIKEFTDMAAEALTRHYVDLTLQAVNAACAVGAQDVKGRALRTVQTAGSTDVTKTSLDEAIRRLGQFASGVTIFGTRWALDPIYDIAANAGGDALKEELVRRGVIGTYRGARLVVLNDDYNEFYGQWTKVDGVDLDRLIFVAAAQPGAVLLERDLSPLNWEETDPEKAQFRTGTRFDHGIFVHSPYLYHVIELPAS